MATQPTNRPTATSSMTPAESKAAPTRTVSVAFKTFSDRTRSEVENMREARLVRTKTLWWRT